jgi:hypothetical protein
MAGVLHAEERPDATTDVGRTAASHGTRPALWGQYGRSIDPAPGLGARPWHDGPVRPPGLGWAGAVDARRYGHSGGHVPHSHEFSGGEVQAHTDSLPT